MGSRYVLAGDIGGTKTLLQLAAVDGNAVARIFQKSYASPDHAELTEIVQAFLRETNVDAEVAAACFAVAGPVVDRRARLTNLPWQVDAAEISSRLGIARVDLINDFAAVGLGLARLPADDLLCLQEGRPETRGVRAAIGAGTGLGVTWLTWNGARYIAHPSEGGHADFAPVGERQQQLLQHLRKRHGHVSFERILSGPGLAAVYDFFCEQHGRCATDIDTGKNDAPSLIAKRAGGDDDRAARALDLFIEVYGGFAGNLALITLATGGLYIAGGIAPKIATQLADGRFIRAFLDKGRYAGLLSNMPVYVVMNPEVGLIGAATEAAFLLT